MCRNKSIRMNPLTQLTNVTLIIELSTVVSPFKKSLQINMYNYNFFGSASKCSIVMDDNISNSINCAPLSPHNDMPNDKYLFKTSSHDIPSIEKSTTLPPTIHHRNKVKI